MIMGPDMPGNRLAEAKQGKVTAYIIQNDTGTSHQLNTMFQEPHYIYEPEEIIIFVTFSTGTNDIFVAPPDKIHILLDEENYTEIKGHENPKNVTYCFNCACPERQEILSHDGSSEFYIHDYCLDHIRQTVQKLQKQTPQVVAQLV